MRQPPASTDAGDASPCDEVPDELLLQVFSHLPPWSLLEIVPRVCRRWRALSQDRSLWHSARLEAGGCTGRDEKLLLATLRDAIALHTLVFGDPFAVVSAQVLRAVIALPAPLSAFHFLPVEYDADLILEVIRKLAPSLEELSLRVHRRLTGSPLLAELATMPRLRALRLLGPLPAALEPAAEGSGWRSLQRLDLRQAVLSGEDFLLNILSSAAERLRALLLPRYVQLSKETLGQLCRCSQLRHLAPSRLEDLPVVEALPQLDDLLVEADLFDPLRHSFVGDLKGLSRVRVLSLRVGDEAGAVRVAAACARVRRLTLRGTLSRWAVRVVENTPLVNSLRLVEPPVRLRLGTADPLPVRMAILEDVCRVLPHLQELDLRDCFQRRAPAALSCSLRLIHPFLRIWTAPERHPQEKDEDDDDVDSEEDGAVSLTA